jgi:hypothetical protein
MAYSIIIRLVRLFFRLADARSNSVAPNSEKAECTQAILKPNHLVFLSFVIGCRALSPFKERS